MPPDPDADSLEDGEETEPLAINNKNQVVGSYINYTDNFFLNKSHGFVYSDSKFYSIDYLYADPVYTVFRGINNKGQIVGEFIDNSFVHHGFVYSGYNEENFAGGVFSNITPNAEFTGINDNGQIVGYGLTGSGFLADSFLRRSAASLPPGSTLSISTSARPTG